MKINKMKLTLMSLLMVALIITMPMMNTYALKMDEPEVKVEVFINKYDEEYIKNIEFDDGTVVGDYDYYIEYISPLSLMNEFGPLYLQLGEYFDYAGWITRDGLVSVSLDPNDDVRGSSSLANEAWNCLRSPLVGFGSDPRWPSDDQCLKWQYDCHYYFANDKDRWNIEPSRTASNYLEVVLASCNP